MDKLIAEVRAYSAQAGLSPQSVLRKGISAGWGEWDSWLEGRSSPTMIRGDRLRRWMAENPPARCRGADAEDAA